MVEMKAEFHGLEPWPAHNEVTECVTPERVFDLHNECTLVGATTSCTPQVEFRLRFLEDASGRRFDLVFSQVQHLQFQQDDRASTPGDWSPNEVETFIGLQLAPSDLGPPRFAVETIIGEFSFVCPYVAFTRLDD